MSRESEAPRAPLVAIDARWIFERLSGIGLYTRELIRALLDLDAGFDFLLLFNDAALRDRTVSELGSAAESRVRLLLLKDGVFSPLNQITLPFVLKRENVDLYHSTNYMIPLAAFPRNRRGTVACVTTIHDVIPLALPSHAPRSRKSRLFPLYRLLMREVGRRSDVVLTVSDASRRDILKHLHIAPERASRVRRIYNGVSDAFKPPAPLPPPPAARPLDRLRTVLYVGRFDPYKNLITLVRAFARLRKVAPFPVELCIVGEPDPRYPEPVRLVSELALDAHVRFVGHLGDDALRARMAGADILAHPSLYEGFGLQVLEAMAAGLPVACSDRTSLPEVAGEAALLFDPDNVEDISAAMLRLLTDGALYTSLRAAGLERAKRFTWRRSAEETAAVYRDLASARA